MDQVDILLIDDNAVDTELLIRALRTSEPSIRTHVIHDAEQTILQLYGAENIPPSINPRLILIDVNLPTITGIELVRHIKADPRTKYIPVIMLSASQDEKVIESCYLAGANSYVVKPVNYDRFEEFSRLVAPYWLNLNQLPYNVQ